MKSGIDVIVVNYQTPNELDAFCRSYAKYPPIDGQLHIVNNEPNIDDALVAVEWGGLFNATVHINPQNVGYARAVNAAASHGGREIIAIFNADTELTEGLLDECAEELLAHQDWGVLGPRQVDDQNRLTHGGILGSLDQPFLRGWLQVDKGTYTKVEEAVSVSGAAYFVKRSVWEELTQCPVYQEIAPQALGAFLPTPHYFEETFASYHAQAHGHRCIYYGPARMIHKWAKAGSGSEDHYLVSQEIFRSACERHGLAHD